MFDTSKKFDSPFSIISKIGFSKKLIFNLLKFFKRVLTHFSRILSLLYILKLSLYNFY